MSPPKPQAAASIDAARSRILRAAARLCAVHGYEGTSIREIAQAAGVTKPLVHYYFGSKERLFATMLRESVEESHCAARTILARPVSATEKLRALLGWHFTRAREVPEIVGFAHAIKNLPEALPIDFDYRSACDQFHAMLVELICEGQRNGEFRAVDPHAVVMMASATVQAYVNAIFAGDVESTPGVVEDLVLDLIVNGVGAAAPVAPAAAAPVAAVSRRARAARRGAAAVVFLMLGAGARHEARAQAAPDTLRLSLAECTGRALAAGEEMQRAGAGRTMARSAYTRARADVFPQLTFTGGYTRQLESVFQQDGTFDVAPFEPDTLAALAERVRDLERNLPTASIAGLTGLFDAGPFASEHKWEGTLHATQKLFEGGSLWGSMQVARHALRSVESTHEDRGREVTLMVREAYLGALLADRGVQIAALALQQADTQYQRVRLRQEAGQTSEFEMLRAQVQRDNQEPAVKQARNAREVAYLQLRGIANLPPLTPVVLVTPLLASDAIPPGAFAAVDTAGLVTAALQGPEVVALDEALQARRHAVAVAGRDRWPALSLFGTLSQQAFPSRFRPRRDDFRRDASVGARFDWTLFDGLNTRGAVADARAQVTIAAQELAQGRESVFLRVQQNRGELERAAADLQARGRTVGIAKRAFELANLRYEEGASSLLEVADARLDYQVAQSYEAQARHDFFVALARLERDTGKPLFTRLAGGG